MSVLEAALAYLRIGITTIPVSLDGSKSPDGRALPKLPNAKGELKPAWKQFIKTPPTENEVRKMFARPTGLAVLGGKTSGGLEIIDFDRAECFEPWCDLVEHQEPGLIARLPVVKTPNGYHVYFRSDSTEGNQKLAMGATPTEKKKSSVIIETRGEGGYVIAPPSPAEVHPSGTLYVFIRKIEGDVPRLSTEERNILISSAQSFTEVAQHVDEEPRGETSTLPTGKGRPGDEFAERTPWHEILRPHGWRVVRELGQVTHWQRPGKDDRGISATTGFTRDKLYVFSSNAQPFESQRAYGKFSAFAWLSHGGDFSAASRDLRDRGFGEPRQVQAPRKPTASQWSALTEGINRISSGPALALVPPPDVSPLPTDADAPPDMQQPPRLGERINAERLEALLDDDPAAAMRPGMFERLLAMRSDMAEWSLISDVLRRKKKKAEFNAAAKRHDSRLRARIDSTGWRSQLQYREAKDGSPVLEKCLANLALILTHDDAWTGVLRLNTFSNRITAAPAIPFNRDPGSQWTDADTLAVKIWIESNYPLRPTTNDVNEAIIRVATDQSFNPLKDYFEKLEGGEREVLDTWLIDFFGADDNMYTRAVGARWMIGAVARALNPGCKVDNVLILEGKQGFKKSSVLEKLCPDEAWFIDGLSDFGSKDQKEEVQGRWIVELGELKGFGKELEQIKAFVTRKSEKYRPSYARYTIDSPRTCVFAGTVNPDGAGYLRDVTGNRRFWPVKCVRVATEMTKALRDQLWAEAKARYEAGEKWWIDADETELLEAATQQQNERVEMDVWQEEISLNIAGHESVSVNELLSKLGVDVDKRGQREAQRIARVLKFLGWERYRETSNGRPWRYRPTDDAEHRRQASLPL